MTIRSKARRGAVLFFITLYHLRAFFLGVFLAYLLQYIYSITTAIGCSVIPSAYDRFFLDNICICLLPYEFCVGSELSNAI